MDNYQISYNDLKLIMAQMDRIENKLDQLHIQEPKTIFNTKEMAELLGVTSRTLFEYRSIGLLSYSQVGKKIFYHRDDYLDFLKRHRKEVF